MPGSDPAGGPAAPVAGGAGGGQRLLPCPSGQEGALPAGLSHGLYLCCQPQGPVLLALGDTDPSAQLDGAPGGSLSKEAPLPAGARRILLTPGQVAQNAQRSDPVRRWLPLAKTKQERRRTHRSAGQAPGAVLRAGRRRPGAVLRGAAGLGLHRGPGLLLRGLPGAGGAAARFGGGRGVSGLFPVFIFDENGPPGWPPWWGLPCGWAAVWYFFDETWSRAAPTR